MSLRALLREATRDEHERLERMVSLDHPALAIPEYVEYLRCAHAFHRDMEPALDHPALREWGIDVGGRGKLAWLEDDLRFFGAPPIARDADPHAGPPEGLLGRAYVLEGRVLHDRFAERWGLARGRGATFLHGYGTQTGRMWRRFVAALDGIGLAPAQRAASVDGARATFRAFESVLREQGWSASRS
jgi:heme oxygenase